jgi:anti-sigma factor ChrR (cupin superfamily)
VLSGIFSDSSGDDGPGWCLRHPPGSAHQPSSADGALILRLSAPGGALGWLRLPPGDAPELHAGGTGTTTYLKVGHLTGLAT